MSRASRLLELLQVLRRHRAPVAGPELSRELGVSLRTLYRDIATLREQGADIRGDPGLGYVLRPGFTLPPLNLSEEEIEALVLGARWVAARGDARLGAAAGDVVAKVRAVLPEGLRESVDAATLTVPGVPGVPGVPVATALVDVAGVRAAIRKEHKIVLAYRDERGALTRRTVWPLLIGFFERVMVLAAWCELRGDYRGFRIDRIAACEVTGERYPRPRKVMVEEWREKQHAAAAVRN